MKQFRSITELLLLKFLILGGGGGGGGGGVRVGFFRQVKIASLDEKVDD